MYILTRRRPCGVTNSGNLTHARHPSTWPALKFPDVVSSAHSAQSGMAKGFLFFSFFFLFLPFPNPMCCVAACSEHLIIWPSNNASLFSSLRLSLSFESFLFSFCASAPWACAGSSVTAAVQTNMPSCRLNRDRQMQIELKRTVQISEDNRAIFYFRIVVELDVYFDRDSDLAFRDADKRAVGYAAHFRFRSFFLSFFS